LTTTKFIKTVLFYFVDSNTKKKQGNTKSMGFQRGFCQLSDHQLVKYEYKVMKRREILPVEIENSMNLLKIHYRDLYYNNK